MGCHWRHATIVFVEKFQITSRNCKYYFVLLVNRMRSHGIKQCTPAQPVVAGAQTNQAVEYLGSEGPTTKFVYGSPSHYFCSLYVWPIDCFLNSYTFFQWKEKIRRRIRTIYQNIYTKSVLASVNTRSVQCLKMYLKTLLPCFHFRKMRLCICRYLWNL